MCPGVIFVNHSTRAVELGYCISAELRCGVVLDSCFAALSLRRRELLRNCRGLLGVSDLSQRDTAHRGGRGRGGREVFLRMERRGWNLRFSFIQSTIQLVSLIIFHCFQSNHGTYVLARSAKVRSNQPQTTSIESIDRPANATDSAASILILNPLNLIHWG